MTGSIKGDRKLNDLNQNSGENKRGIADCYQGFGGGEAFVHGAIWVTAKIWPKAVDKSKRKDLKADHLRQRRITILLYLQGMVGKKYWKWQY